MDSIHILVVDDIYANRLLLSELIKLTENKVTLVENGAQAIEALRSDDFQLIFMDIEMPVMNGIETTNYIRNEMPYPLNAIPIIALTAHNPELFFDDFSDAGFDELITKPYSIDKIKNTIVNTISGI